MNYPTLFQEDKKTKIGVLTDCISCNINETLSTSFEFQLDYPINGKYSDKIKVDRYIKAKPNPYDNEQLFKIYRIGKAMNDSATYYAEHVSYALNGYIGKADSTYKEIGGNIHTAISYLNTQGTGFTFIADYDDSDAMNWSIDAPTDIRSIMAQIASWWGGEWIYDNYICTFVKERGKDRGAKIEYGENLLDFTSDVDTSERITHIVPYWKGTDENGNEIIVYADNYYVKVFNVDTDEIKAIPLDCSSEFSEKPVSVQLEIYAIEYARQNLVENNLYNNTGYSVDFVQRGKTIEFADMGDIDHVEIGDIIHISVPSYNITAAQRCTATNYDALADRYIDITVGRLYKPVNQTIAELQRLETKTAEMEKKPTETDEPPDRIVKDSDNKVSAYYPKYTVVYEADGEGNERHNFRKTVTPVESGGD